MARSRRLALLGLVTTTLGTIRVEAQEPLPPVKVSYHAPAECPTREDFEARVLARTGKTGLYPEGNAEFELFDVELTPTPERTRGRLTTHARNASPTVREIQAGTCQEAVDALALIVALTLDPASVRQTGGTPPTETGTGETKPPGSTDQTGTGSDHPGSKKGTGEKGTTEPGKKPGEETSSDEVPPLPPAGDGSATKARIHVEFLFAGLVADGMAPDPMGGGQASFGLVFPAFDPHGLLLRIGARATLNQTENTEQGNATFKWLSGFLGLGPQFELGSGFAVAGCVSGELGLLQAEGSETSNATTSQQVWAAVGPGAIVDFRFWGPFFAHLGGEADFPLLRQSYMLGRRQVYETPVLIWRAEAGLGARL